MLTLFTLRCQIMAGYPRPMLATIEESRFLSKSKAMLRSNLEQDRRSIMQGAAQSWSTPGAAYVTPRASLVFINAARARAALSCNGRCRLRLQRDLAPDPGPRSPRRAAPR